MFGVFVDVFISSLLLLLPCLPWHAFQVKSFLCRCWLLAVGRLQDDQEAIRVRMAEAISRALAVAAASATATATTGAVDGVGGDVAMVQVWRWRPHICVRVSGGWWCV